MPLNSCLALTSFPMINQNQQNLIYSMMMTPILNQSKEISRNRTDRLLSKGRWNSYRYSKRNNRYESISRKERKKRSSRGSYIHFQDQPEKDIPDSSTTAIIENDGKRYTGKTSAIPTADLSPKTQKASELKTARETRPVNTYYGSNRSGSKNCTSIGDSRTESKSLCVDCEKRNIKQAVRRFFGTLRQKLSRKKICTSPQTTIKIIKNNFNQNCQPINFEEYVQELTCQSCDNRVPPALMLSMMTAESSGKCQIQGDGGTSHGLFQINRNSTNKRSCSSNQKSQIRKSSSLNSLRSQPQCLQNPVVNLEESLKILKEKYKITNDSYPNFNCQYSDLKNMDSWRKAVAGYNGGQRRIQILERLSKKKPDDLSAEAWNKMSEWEKIRNYYFSCERDDVSNCDQERFEQSVSNLAHTELILGSSNSSQNPSLFQAWNQHLTRLNNNNQCSR